MHSSQCNAHQPCPRLHRVWWYFAVPVRPLVVGSFRSPRLAVLLLGSVSLGGCGVPVATGKCELASRPRSHQPCERTHERMVGRDRASVYAACCGLESGRGSASMQAALSAFPERNVFSRGVVGSTGGHCLVRASRVRVWLVIIGTCSLYRTKFQVPSPCPGFSFLQPFVAPWRISDLNCKSDNVEFAHPRRICHISVVTHTQECPRYREIPDRANTRRTPLCAL